MIKKNKIKHSVDVLRKIVKKYQDDPSQKKNLLEDGTEASLLLQITLKKIPGGKNIKMIKVPLPNSVLKDTGTVCLIAGDTDKKNHKAEIDPDILHYEEVLKSKGITCISDVFTLRQLRTEYKPYEAKQKLLGAYDMFLTEKKIAGALPKVLGRHFFKKRKYPIQIDFESKDLKKEIEKALSFKVLFLTGHGNSCAVEVANLDMDDSEIVENVMAAVNTLSEKLPGSWNNVMGVYLKTSRSKAVPLYMSFDSANDIKLEVKNEVNIVEDDLSTVPNASVRVYSDGRVECKRTVQSGDSDELDDDMSSIEGDELQDSGVKRKRSGKTPKNLLLPECDQIDENNTSEIDSSLQKKSRKKLKKVKTSMESIQSATIDFEESKKASKKEKINKESKESVTLNSEGSQAVKSLIKTKKSKKQPADEEQTDIIPGDFEDSQAVKSLMKTKNAKKSKKQPTDEEQTDVIPNYSEDSQTVKSSVVTRKIKKSKKQIASTERETLLPEESQAVTSLEETNKKKRSEKKATNKKNIEVLARNFEDSPAVTSIETEKIKKSKKQTELLTNDSEVSKPLNSGSKKMKKSKKETSNLEIKPSSVFEEEPFTQKKKPNKRKRGDSESTLLKDAESINEIRSPAQVLKKKRLEGNIKKHIAMKDARKNKKDNRVKSK